MSRISITTEGFLSVESDYADREVIKQIGGRWDGIYKVWSVAFTSDNLEHLIDNLPDVTLSDAVEQTLLDLEQREKRLAELRVMSKNDVPIRLKVPGLKLGLYNYQRWGVMYALANGSGILIADEMGLGKTLQALATALFLKDRGKIKNALIVTPASLKFNWPIEIEKFTDEKYVIVDGTPEERVAQWLREDVFFYIVNYELLLEDLFGGKTPKQKPQETHEQKRRREATILRNKKRRRILTPVRRRTWDFVAVDEAHALKNHSSKRSKNVKQLKSGFRMALTGTPMDGRLEELHSVIDFVMPGLLESRTRFLQKYAVCDFYGKVKAYKNIDEVRERLAPYFIRRLKKDVLSELPDKIYENRSVVLSPAERKVYEALADKGHEVTEDAEAFTCVLRCKQYCDHPQLIDETQKSSKLEALREILEEVIIENEHKVLVFSQFKQMLNLLVPLFDEMGLKYLRIDGDVDKRERAKMQEQFNTSHDIDIMVGTEAMSTGLNFTSADYVINYDDNWAPAYMAQRADRAHRIGQKSVVTVVNFIVRDTIEERIRSVLYSKSKISDQALGDNLTEAVLRRLSLKEQARLL